MWHMRPRQRLSGTRLVTRPEGSILLGSGPARCTLLSCSRCCMGLGAQRPWVPWPGRPFHALPSHWGPSCPSAKGQSSTSSLALDVAVSSAPRRLSQQPPSHGPASNLAGSGAGWTHSRLHMLQHLLYAQLWGTDGAGWPWAFRNLQNPRTQGNHHQKAPTHSRHGSGGEPIVWTAMML